MTFPVGYHSLHPDASMNFQMNRWFGWVGEPDMLEEMRTAAPRIVTFADWKREFLALAESASKPGAKCTIVFFGGFDSYIALRAAALEPRVTRVVAYDVLTNLLDVNLRRTGTAQRTLLKVLPRLKAAGAVDWMVERVARKSPVVRWGIEQGMRVTGTRSAFEFLQMTERIQTNDVSALISQDVLLLAGSEDHYVPIAQWYDQIRMLGNARSITARLFTRSECAQNHCQVGSYGLALRTIVTWLDGMLLGDARPTPNHLAGVA